MSAVSPIHAVRWFVIITSICGSLSLTSCMNPEAIKPAVDMFSIYDGHASTAAEREQAIRDCDAYMGSFRISGPMAVGMQICMLQLGFRAPNGELPGQSSSIIDPGGDCVNDAYMPVCWAVKYGWPQNPPQRWTKPGADPDNLGNVWYGCYVKYVTSPYAMFVAQVDQCMAQRYGYIVVHPHSPAAPWFPHQYWPNCAKPEDERNWIEKKWCPSEPAATPTLPNSAALSGAHASSHAS